MRHLLFIIISTNFILSLNAQTPYNSPQLWSLVQDLSDEFNNFDSNKWTNGKGCNFRPQIPQFVLNPKSYGTSLNNISYGIPTGSTSGSALQLKMKKESTSLNEGCAVPSRYSGAQISSKIKFQYGYYEIRAKLPSTTLNVGGTFWLWNQKCPDDYIPGNRYTEIDVYEMCSSGPSVFPLYLHTSECNSCWRYGLFGDESYKNHYTLPGVDFTNYHIIALDWQPNYIDWYVDNQLVHHMDNINQMYTKNCGPGSISPNQPLPASIQAISIPLQVVFDAAPSEVYGSSDTDFPDINGQTYEIDYFRYYKKTPTLSIYSANLAANTANLSADAIPGDNIIWNINNTSYNSSNHVFNMTPNTNYPLNQVSAQQTIDQTGHGYANPISVQSTLNNAYLSYGGQGVLLNTTLPSQSTLIYISESVSSSTGFGSTKNVVIKTKTSIDFYDGFEIGLGGSLIAEADIIQ